MHCLQLDSSNGVVKHPNWQKPCTPFAQLYIYVTDEVEICYYNIWVVTKFCPSYDSKDNTGVFLPFGLTPVIWFIFGIQKPKILFEMYGKLNSEVQCVLFHSNPVQPKIASVYGHWLCYAR